MKPRTAERRALQRSPTRVRLANGTAATVTSITLPRALHWRVKRVARRLNWTLAEVVRAALEAWLGGGAGTYYKQGGKRK